MFAKFLYVRLYVYVYSLCTMCTNKIITIITIGEKRKVFVERRGSLARLITKN